MSSLSEKGILKAIKPNEVKDENSVLLTQNDVFNLRIKKLKNWPDIQDV